MSIRSKLWILAVGICVAVIGMSVLTYFWANDLFGRRLEESGQASARDGAEIVVQYFEKLRMLAETTAAATAFHMREGHSVARMDDHVETLVSSFLERHVKTGIQDVFVGIEANGSFADGSGWREPEGYDCRKRSWYRRAADQGRTVVADPYVDMITRVNVLSVTTPVRSEDGALLGVAGVDVDLKHLQSLVQPRRVFGSGFGMLIGRDGVILAAPYPELLLAARVTDRGFADSSFLNAAEKMMEGGSGQADVTFRGERWRLFFHPCGTGAGDISGMSFGLLFPEREISAMARDVAILHMGGGLISLLLVLLVIIPTASGILKALTGLRKTSERIAEQFAPRRDLAEAALSLNLLHQSVVDQKRQSGLSELSSFLGGLESALSAISGQQEEISALTEETMAMNDELIRTNEALRRREEIWTSTLDVTVAISSPGEFEGKLHGISETIRQAAGAFGVLAARIDGDMAINLASAGYRGRTLPLAAPLDGTVVGRVVRTGLTAWVERVDQDPEYFRLHENVQTEAILPLLEMGQVIGILELAFDRRTPRNEELLETLHPVTSALAGLIGAEYLHREILDSYRYLAEKLQSITGIHHYETAEHTERIGEYSRLATQWLGRSREDQENIFVFARLHDLGKLRVPVEILTKPGALTPEEMDVIRRHPEWGREIIGDARWLEMARRICMTHHERWDGSGYPLGLRGDEIPWEGQVVALADVYDALRSPRAYKQGMSHEDAYRVILEGDGRTMPEHFNPAMLECFREHHREMERIFAGA